MALTVDAATKGHAPDCPSLRAAMLNPAEMRKDIEALFASVTALTTAGEGMLEALKQNDAEITDLRARVQQAEERERELGDAVAKLSDRIEALESAP